MSSKDSGHGDSEQGDSDHDATHRGHSSGQSSASFVSVYTHCAVTAANAGVNARQATTALHINLYY